jgi:ribosomal protein S18 acetylase RimI-like enzyme
VIKSDSGVSIRQSLSKSQVLQLINYSTKDPLIANNTEDSRRFKDEETYLEWLKKGKYIYALTDSGKNLQGLAWFSQKLPPPGTGLNNKYKYTFAIRIYPDLRGKGWAEKLMNKSFSIFLASPEYLKSPGNFWLTTRENNLPAINLYKKFGFLEVGISNKFLTMKLEASNFQNSFS